MHEPFCMSPPTAAGVFYTKLSIFIESSYKLMYNIFALFIFK